MKCDHDITITPGGPGREVVACSKCGMKKTRVAAYMTNPAPMRVNGSPEGARAIDGTMVEGEG